jgi:two-component system, OmpR family, sensor histidine kinase SenX3
MNKPILPPLDAQTDPKTEFFMAASHQLKSPVAIVQWCLQSALENPSLDVDTRKLIDRALGQANAMGELLGDMLRVFKIVHANGEAVQTLVPVDLTKLIHEALQEYVPIATQQGVRLVPGTIEQLPTLLGEEAYLKQAIINVIDNAIKYSSRGGSVDIAAQVRSGMIEIAVTDHGIGIPEAEQGRLFTEFFRGNLAKEKTTNGTGLGLVLVKHIVEGLGGSVSCKSQVGKGSTFLLQIPAS